MRRGHCHRSISGALHFLTERLRGQRQHLGPPGLDLHHVAHGLIEKRRVGPQRDDQRSRLNEGNGAVLQLTGGVCLGVDIADLLELQRALQAHGVIQIPADEENGIMIKVPGGEILHILRAVQYGLQLFRQSFQLMQDGRIFLMGDRSQQVTEIKSDHVHQGQLRGICLCGSHGDLRPRPCIEHIVRLPGDGGTHHVHNGQRPAAKALGLPQGGHGIQRFAGLADEDHQGVIVHQRIAVAELRGEAHLHWAAEQALPVILADHAHMVAGAAGHDENTANAAYIVRCQVQVIQHHPSVPDAGRDCFADSLRLLKNLLEHEVGIAALFCGGHIPVHMAVGLINGVHLVIEKVDTLRRQHGDLAVLHVNNVPGMPDDRRYIGGDEIFPLAAADDKRAVLTGGDKSIGIVGTDDAESVGALNAPQHTAHGLQHIMAFPVMELQKLGHYFRVRF